MESQLLNQQAQFSNRFRRFYQDVAPKLKKRKTQATTTAVFSFLAISLFAWYAVRPTAETIIYLRREIEDKKTLNKQMEDKITALIEAQATYESINSRIPLLEQALPKNPDGAILARQVYTIANQSGATISALQLPSLPLLSQESSAGAKIITPQKGGVSSFPVTMVLSGDYTVIKSFLNGLLSLRRLTTIKSISVKQASGRGILGSGLQLSIRFDSYYSTQ